VHDLPLYLQDRYAYNFSRPVIDTTTTDWYAFRGREENGWTAIQFKRLLDTCDTMDVAIKVIGSLFAHTQRSVGRAQWRESF
jgi:hypothetical protein